MEFLTWNTNELITTFVINNMVLLYMVQKTVRYIAQKTPWTWDDDLAPFLGNLTKGIKKDLDDTPKT